jgi:hypothetical protein
MPVTTPGVQMARGDNVPNIYFTDVFSVPPEILEEYGAFNVALVNDYPYLLTPSCSMTAGSLSIRNCTMGS